jgi:hypothetical protein
MYMVGRNILGLQPAGEWLLAKISSLCFFLYNLFFIVYLINYEIYIYNVHVCWLFFVHGILFISFML